MTKFYIGSLGLLFAISCACVGVGQQTEPRATKDADENARSPSLTQIDRPMVEFFASKLVLCNNAEIQIGQLAAIKTTNSEVKQFAEMLAKDHAKYNELLKPFVASYSAEPGVLATDQTAAIKPSVAIKANLPKVEESAKPKTQTETSLRIGDEATLQRLYEVCRAVHENHMASCKEMLTMKNGSEFDMAFVGSQIVGHMALLSELKALESRTDKDFQIFIRETTKSVQSHMQSAVSLRQTLDGQKGKTETSSR